MGDYRAAVRAGVLAPLSAVEPERRSAALEGVIHAVSVGGAAQLPTDNIKHMVIDRGYPAIGANIIGGLADLDPGGEREVWKHLDREVLEPAMGRTPLLDTVRMFFPYARIPEPGDVLDQEVFARSRRTIRGSVDPHVHASRGEGPGDRVGGGSGSPPGAGVPAAVDAPTPQFFFILEGDHVAGDRVQAGTDFDLAFNYDVLPAGALAGIRGEKLERLRKANADLEIWVTAAGITFRDEVTSKTAKFRGGRLEEPVRSASR